jgi:hypothetical protein
MTKNQKQQRAEIVKSRHCFELEVVLAAADGK